MMQWGAASEDTWTSLLLYSIIILNKLLKSAGKGGVCVCVCMIQAIIWAGLPMLQGNQHMIRTQGFHSHKLDGYTVSIDTNLTVLLVPMPQTWRIYWFHYHKLDDYNCSIATHLTILVVPLPQTWQLSSSIARSQSVLSGVLKNFTHRKRICTESKANGRLCFFWGKWPPTKIV